MEERRRPVPSSEPVRVEPPVFDTLNSEDDSLLEEGVELIQRLEHLRGVVCPGCGRLLCAHQLLVSFALGLGNTPRCLPCTAQEMGQSPLELAQTMFGYFQRRTCYWAAWKWASQNEAVEPESIPPCLAT